MGVRQRVVRAILLRKASAIATALVGGAAGILVAGSRTSANAQSDPVAAPDETAAPAMGADTAAEAQASRSSIDLRHPLAPSSPEAMAQALHSNIAPPEAMIAPSEFVLPVSPPAIASWDSSRCQTDGGSASHATNWLLDCEMGSLPGENLSGENLSGQSGQTAASVHVAPPESLDLAPLAATTVARNSIASSTPAATCPELTACDPAPWLQPPPPLAPPEVMALPERPAAALSPTQTLAQNPIPPVDRSAPPLVAPVANVDELSDVEPGHWAYNALQQLIEKFGCVAGLGNASGKDSDQRTFQGDRPLSRYEFAAALGACLDVVQGEATARREQFLTQDEALLIQRLQQEFAAELSQTRRRIANLEDRVQFLRDRQFSPTTVLGGEVIFGVAAAGGNDPPGRNEGQSVFAHLARLQLVTSFSGKDRLRLQLSASNFANNGFADRSALGTDMARLSYQGNSDNQLRLDLLDYRVATLGDRAVVILRPVGFDLSSVLTANSPFFDTGRGAISRFGEASPLFKIGALDAGFGFDALLSDRLRLQAAWGTRTSSDPSQGLSRADHSAGGVQLLAKPTDTLLVGAAYINAYAEDGRLDTFTGSLNADLSGGLGSPAQIHALSGSLQWRLAPRLTFATWGGWIWTNYLDRSAESLSTTYLFSLAWSDPFGREGDVLALLFGQPPRLVRGEGGIETDPDTALHFELFYRFKVNDHLSITPGVFLITNPEHNADNGTIWVGTIRTTLRF